MEKESASFWRSGTTKENDWIQDSSAGIKKKES
jgi:hypothetical protein